MTDIPPDGTLVTAVPLGLAEWKADPDDPALPDMTGAPETVHGALSSTHVDVSDLRGGRIIYDRYEVDGWDVDPTTIVVHGGPPALSKAPRASSKTRRARS